MYAIRREEAQSVGSGWAVGGLMVTEVFIYPAAHTLSEPALRTRKQWFSVLPALRKRMRQESKQGGRAGFCLPSCRCAGLPASSCYSTHRLHVHLWVLLLRGVGNILKEFLSHRENESSNLHLPSQKCFFK